MPFRTLFAFKIQFRFGIIVTAQFSDNIFLVVVRKKWRIMVCSETLRAFEYFRRFTRRYAAQWKMNLVIDLMINIKQYIEWLVIALCQLDGNLTFIITRDSKRSKVFYGWLSFFPCVSNSYNMPSLKHGRISISKLYSAKILGSAREKNFSRKLWHSLYVALMGGPVLSGARLVKKTSTDCASCEIFVI